MKNKNILLLLAVTFLVAAGLVFFLKPDQATKSVQNIISDENQPEILNTDGEYPRKNLDIPSNDLAKAKTEMVLFHEIQDEDLTNSDALPLSKSGKGMAIAYNQNIIETKNVGDTVKFQMLEYGINREGTIVEIEKVDSDILRWRGKFNQGSPERNFFTITQSQKDQYTIIQIFSDKGNYTAEIKNGQGVVQSIDEGVEDHELHDH